jgi:hypothetical protein
MVKSTANQTLLPLVYQDVGDYRRLQRSRFAAGCIIPGCQFLEFLAARWVSEHQLQFVCPLLERFAWRHESSFPIAVNDALMAWTSSFAFSNPLPL